MPAESLDVHDKLMAILKRRGYLQSSYEIYGGVAGFYDYGPLGATLKQNLQNLWRELYILQEGMAEIECPTISPEPVFRASGHLEKFADTVVECPGCGAGSRGDHLVRGELKRIADAAAGALAKHKLADLADHLARDLETYRVSVDKDPSPDNIQRALTTAHVHLTGPDATVNFAQGALKLVVKGKTVHEDHVKCPACNKPLDIAKANVNAFNLMFKTNVGPGTGRAGYLRPETAQGMFMDFDWLYRYFREKLPFGAVQLGKAYRNEISPRQALLRLREFSQMEAEVFFDPENKTWPRFAQLEGRELNLLAAGETEPTRMPMGEAVRKGIIANGALGYFIALTDVFLDRAGLRKENVRFRQHEPTEKAHYSTDTWDAEFLSPRFGWVEIVGIADRTDYDLGRHSEVSGVKLEALRRFPEAREVEVNRVVPNPAKLGPLFKGKAGKVSEALKALNPDKVQAGKPLTVSVDGETLEIPADAYRVERGTERVEGETYVPHVVEPSYGVDRIFYATLEGAYSEKEWVVLRLPPKLAPIKVGVFPLMAKDGLDTAAQEIETELRHAGILPQYDEGGSIGKRYARMDEIGTPFCVTVDYDTLSGGTVTIRDRDSAQQVRVPRAQVVDLMGRLTREQARFEDVPGPRIGSTEA